MIPTMLLAGFIVGLLPARWAIVGVVLLGLLWPVGVAVGPVSISGITDVLGMIGFGMVNAAVGAAVGHLLRSTILAALTHR